MWSWSKREIAKMRASDASKVSHVHWGKFFEYFFYIYLENVSPIFIRSWFIKWEGENLRILICWQWNIFKSNKCVECYLNNCLDDNLVGRCSNKKVFVILKWLFVVAIPQTIILVRFCRIRVEIELKMNSIKFSRIQYSSLLYQSHFHQNSSAE